MLTTPTSRPSRWSMRVTKAATLALPAGPVRDRYRRELVAELYGMTGRQQARQVLGVLVHAPALRSALADHDHGDQEVAMRHAPIRCRLGQHHYRWHTTEDGTRYQQCERCGEDRGPDGPGGTGGLANMGG
jgi:hypothetical protein